MEKRQSREWCGRCTNVALNHCLLIKLAVHSAVRLKGNRKCKKSKFLGNKNARGCGKGKEAAARQSQLTNKSNLRGLGDLSPFKTNCHHWRKQKKETTIWSKYEEKGTTATKAEIALETANRPKRSKVVCSSFSKCTTTSKAFLSEPKWLPAWMDCRGCFGRWALGRCKPKNGKITFKIFEENKSSLLLYTKKRQF